MSKKKSNKELLESFSQIVDRALYTEAIGPAIKAGLSAGKGLVKNIAKHGLKGLTKGNVLQNVGTSMVNDVKQMANDAYDATPMGALRNTFKDENGNWSFSPTRALKKQVSGALKTADNILTGGVGQMAYDAVAGDNEEEVQQSQQQPVQQVQQQTRQQQRVQQQRVQQQPVQQSQQQPVQQVQQQPAAQTQQIQQPVKKVKKSIQKPVAQQPVQQPAL